MIYPILHTDFDERIWARRMAKTFLPGTNTVAYKPPAMQLTIPDKKKIGRQTAQTKRKNIKLASGGDVWEHK